MSPLAATLPAAREDRIGLAVVLIAPLVAVWLMRVPLVSQLNYPDPWFYSGYGWSFQHHIDVFGWMYYSIRFPATMPIGWFADAFGPVPGYLLLRYLIFVVTGGLLYWCLRNAMGVRAAIVGVVLLAVSPFYLRMVLWDYTSFVELPAMIAAVALWHVGGTGRGRLVSAFACGTALGLAVFANPLGALIVPALFGVELVAAARGGASAFRDFAVRLALAFAAAMLVFLAGWIAYRIKIGSIPLYQMIKPAVDFTRAGSFDDFFVPASTWLREEPRVYAPLLLCLAIIVVHGRALFGTSVAARLAQTAVGFTLMMWVMRKLNMGALVETWWAYNLTAITYAFGLPALIVGLERRSGLGRSVAVAVVTATVAAGFTFRTANLRVAEFTAEVREHLWLLVAVLVVGATLAIALRLVGRRLVAAAAAVFAAVLMGVSLLPAVYLGSGEPGEFSQFGTAAELDAYDAAFRMAKLLERYDDSESRTLVWNDLAGLGTVTWTNLPHQFGAIDDPSAPVPPPALVPPQIERLQHPLTKRVLFLTADASLVAPALETLRDSFPTAQVEKRSTWGDGRLSYVLVRLQGTP